MFDVKTTSKVFLKILSHCFGSIELWIKYILHQYKFKDSTAITLSCNTDYLCWLSLLDPLFRNLLKCWPTASCLSGVILIDGFESEPFSSSRLFLVSLWVLYRPSYSVEPLDSPFLDFFPKKLQISLTVLCTFDLLLALVLQYRSVDGEQEAIKVLGVFDLWIRPNFPHWLNILLLWVPFFSTGSFHSRIVANRYKNSISKAERSQYRI